MQLSRLKALCLLVVSTGGFVLLPADVVETKSGARLTGTVTKVSDGAITLATDYAGVVVIKQAEVTRLETEKPLVVRLVGGTTMEGTLAATPEGQITVTGRDGTITTTADKVASTWSPGEPDPAVAQLMRKWKYEASFDISGRSGNSDEMGYGGGAKATLAGPQDTLFFYTTFAYQETNDVKSEDKLNLGVDYSSYLTERTTWYARDEGGYNNVKDIEFYNVAASGFGYDLIKNLPKQKLTGRLGLSYRFEEYGDPANEDVRSAGLDTGLSHTYLFSNASLNNNLTFVPTFEDFGNFRAIHDSNLEFPLVGSWKFRVGINHDYTSKPSVGVEKLDTTYYGRFVLNWE